MIVPIARPAPAANATNHPNRCYRFLKELPTVGNIRPRRRAGPPFNAPSGSGRRAGKLAVGFESRTHAIPAGFARNTKPQPCRSFAEGAHNYSGGSKMLKNLMGAPRRKQPEQSCAAQNLDSCLRQYAGELSRRARQSGTRGVKPSTVFKG